MNFDLAFEFLKSKGCRILPERGNRELLPPTVGMSQAADGGLKYLIYE